MILQYATNFTKSHDRCMIQAVMVPTECLEVMIIKCPKVRLREAQNAERL